MFDEDGVNEGRFETDGFEGVDGDASNNGEGYGYPAGGMLFKVL